MGTALRLCYKTYPRSSLWSTSSGIVTAVLKLGRGWIKGKLVLQEHLIYLFNTMKVKVLNLVQRMKKLLTGLI